MANPRKGLQLSLAIHATVYAIVIVGLWRLNQRTSPDTQWAEIVAWAWGIGLAAHAVVCLFWGRSAPAR
jgi:steroid 5-alpha reductase family enzyme